MFKLIFFFFLLFIIYKAIQFISQVYQVYERSRTRESQNGQNGKQGYQKQYDGHTTIHYHPKNEERTTHSKHKGKDDDYIDFEEIKENSR